LEFHRQVRTIDGIGSYWQENWQKTDRATALSYNSRDHAFFAGSVLEQLRRICKSHYLKCVTLEV